MESRIELVKQSLFINKIEKYLAGRGRENILSKGSATKIEGLCNGAVLYLFEKLFYDCLNRYYQQKNSGVSKEVKPIDYFLQEAISTFFKEIEDIINTEDSLLDSGIHQQKLGNRKLIEYKNARNKLETAIESGELTIPKEVKTLFEEQFNTVYTYDGIKKLPAQAPEDYFLTLVNTAKEQNLLSDEEALCLQEGHISDIPLFERFISQIFLLQTTDKTFSTSQYEIAHKFSLLDANPKAKKVDILELEIDEIKEPTKESEKIAELPKPVLEYDHSYLLKPGELMKKLEEILPDERLVWIGLPKHTVCAFRIANQYFYYDPNNEKKQFIQCHNPMMLVLKLTLTMLSLVTSDTEISDEEFKKISGKYVDFVKSLEFDDDFLDKSRNWLANEPKASLIQLWLLKIAIEKLEQFYSRTNLIEKTKQADEEEYMLQVKAMQVLPQTIGFTWKVFSHPNSHPHQYPDGGDLISDKTFKEIILRTDSANETLFNKLAKHDQYQLLDYFLKKIKDPSNELTSDEQKMLLNATDQEGGTLLQIICLAHPEKTELIEELLKAGANPNIPDKNGGTVLQIICLAHPEKTDLIEQLLKADANPNIADKTGKTPLLTAISKSNIALVELLINYGADANQKTVGQHSAFTFCCSLPHVCAEIFDKLLPHAKPTEKYQGIPAIILSICANNENLVAELLKQGFDANSRLDVNSTSELAKSFPQGSALEIAISGGNPKIVSLLLQNNANPNLKDAKGHSYLFHAVKNNSDIEIVKMLLNHGAKLNKNELSGIDLNHCDPKLLAFINFPCLAKGETIAQQLGFLFDDYANPPVIAGFFPTTSRHYKAIAAKISIGLQKPENKDSDNDQIKIIIEGFLKELPEGYSGIRNGEFKKRIDLAFQHFLKLDLSIVRKEEHSAPKTHHHHTLQRH